MLADEDLQDCPFLILANKQDLPTSMTETYLCEVLDLHKLRNRDWCKYIESFLVSCFLCGTFCSALPSHLETQNVVSSKSFNKNSLSNFVARRFI